METPLPLLSGCTQFQVICSVYFGIRCKQSMTLLLVKEIS